MEGFGGVSRTWRTADAMHCQKATAEAINARGGEYVLAVKGNQKMLFEDIQLLFDDSEAMPDDVAQTVDRDHGRIETRRAAVVRDVAWLAEQHGFPGLVAVGKVEAAREIDGKATTACRYYVLSTPLSPLGKSPSDWGVAVGARSPPTGGDRLNP
jgi:hypothetical protein